MVLEKAHFDPSVFSKDGNFSPYQIKQKVQKPSMPQRKSNNRPTNSLIPTNGFYSLENATKIYRMPSNRETDSKKASNFDYEKNNENVVKDSEIFVGSSVTKPKPPSAVTLKYNSNILLKPRRVPKTVANRTRKEKNDTNEKTDEPETKQIFESTAISTKVQNKADALASLKKLSLIEPFLGTTISLQSETKSASTLRVPLTSDAHRNGIIGFSKTSSGIRNSLKRSGLAQKGLNQPNSNMNCSGWKKTKIGVHVEELSETNNDAKHDVTMSNDLLIPPYSYANDMLYLISNKGDFESRKEDYIDTSDKESFVYRDAYNNKISVKEEANVKPQHETPISIVASLNEPPKPPNKRQSYLTQRQLSFVGAAVPTATVVDISTGSIVENNKLSTSAEDTESQQQVQGLRAGAISKAGGVPSSFYHNRKIQRRKLDDRAEMIELSKLKDKARDDIKSILGRLDSPDSQKYRPLSRSRTVDSQKPLKKPVEYKIVRLPSPSQVVVEKDHLKPASSPVAEPTVSRCSSTLTTSSSSSCSTRQPSAPNPSPQLAPNRFQLFPTSNPNTFHAYTSSTSQPTVISMDHFCLAKASLNEQGNDKNKRRSTGVVRKAGNIVGVRIPTSGDNRLKQQETLKTDTLVKGQSISLKNQYKSDSETCSDKEAEAMDDIALKSSEEDSDDKKSLQTPPQHATNKFFKFSNSGVAKVKKPKDENPEVVTYTPLQSLVIKSCQSVNPVVVIPEFQSGPASEMPNSALLARTQTMDGNISPLKGIRILRRKITIKHYDNDTYPYSGKIEYKTLLSDTHKLRQETIGRLDQKQPKNYETKAFNNYLPPTTEKLDSIRTISSKYNSEDEQHHHVNGRLQLQQPNLVYHGQIDDNFVEKSINIDKLCLGKYNAPPFLLLKEGTMQSLNFINPNALQFSLAPLSQQDAKDATERSAKRRRKIQLGTNSGSDDCVSVKIAAGGGFKSNVARYSLLLRQKYHKQQEEPTQKQLQREKILEISKTGIEPLKKNDKQSHEILGRNSSPESDTLPAVEGSRKESGVKSSNCALPSQSRLQIRDLLDNLCSSGEPFNSESPQGVKNERIPPDSNEQDLENCRKHLSLTKSPSLSDLHANNHYSK